MRYPTGMRTAAHSSRHIAGFTLIEVLAVILILSILMTFIVISVGGTQKTMQIENTRAWLLRIGGMIDEYERQSGKYPPSSFPADMEDKPSRLNMGIEMLVITLWSQDSGWQAPEIPEELLGNTDGDRTKTSLTTFTSADAFELLDEWENPIAYIHRRDYDTEITYLTYDEEMDPRETLVKALVSRKTGDPYRRQSFQLISAGPDGVFQTGDDIANFKIERD